MATPPVRSSRSPRRSRPDAGRAPARASKISVTVDAGVIGEVRRLLRGTGGTLSAHVTDALARDLRRRRLQELIDAYEASAGAITEDEIAEARAAWRA